MMASSSLLVGTWVAFGYFLFKAPAAVFIVTWKRAPVDGGSKVQFQCCAFIVLAHCRCLFTHLGPYFPFLGLTCFTGNCSEISQAVILNQRNGGFAKFFVRSFPSRSISSITSGCSRGNRSCCLGRLNNFEPKIPAK